MLLAGIVVLIVLNAGFLIYWQTTDTSVSSAPSMTATPLIPASPSAAGTDNGSPSASSKLRETSPLSAASAVAPAADSANTEAELIIRPGDFNLLASRGNPADQPPASDVVRISELPVDVQQQIPDLIFSSHIFADEAGLRMVNINSKMMREGDQISNDITLREITAQGVVLEYRTYVFEVSVLQDWRF
jgi:general secretion pathway protein B